MSSLKKCLSKIGLEAHEQAIINGSVKDYRADGYEAQAAAVEAVKDYIAQLEDERKDIEGQIKEKAPADVPTEINTVEDISAKYKAQGVGITLFQNKHPFAKPSITLMSLIVPKGMRKQGIGTKVMRDITELADKTGQLVTLTPGIRDDYHGTTSRARLVKFYKHFGFVQNKGRRKDFRINESMYREPKQGQAGPELKTETAEFKKWFKKSKVADSSGNPLVVYHGTGVSIDFNKFDTTFGAHFGSVEQAESRVNVSPETVKKIVAQGGPFSYQERRRVIPVYLSIQNPMRHEDVGGSWADIIEDAKAKGHDGIVYKNEFEARGKGGDSWIAFYPAQIKSAIGNSGRFSPTRKDITASLKERPYANVPDTLMGFGSPYSQKLYDETKYPAELNVTVKYPGGDEWVDAIKGMNFEHALERARRNWPGAEITPGTLVPARPIRASVKTNTKAFRNWFGKSQIVDEDGKPLVVFHGSTHDFKSFSDTRGYSGNFLGRGFYFSSSAEDASANYAGIGPDATSRIEIEKDKYQDVDDYEARDLLNDYFFDNTEILGDVDVDELLDDEEEFERLRAKYLDDAIALAAKKAVIGEHEGAVYPAFLKMERPFYLDDIGMLDKSYTPIGIEIEYSEDGEEIVEESGEGQKLIDAMREVLQWYEVSEKVAEGAIGNLYNKMIDGEINGGDIMAEISELYPQTSDGEMASSGAVLRDIVEKMGYDGIVMDAERHFGPRRGPMGVRLTGMAKVEGAVHFMPFTNTQIKSSIGNIGKFDPTKSDITASMKMNPDSELQIPEFIGSNDAIAFGRVATIDQIDEMRRLYILINDRAKKLMVAPEIEALEQAMTQAYRAQFLHESVMAAEGLADEMVAKGESLSKSTISIKYTKLEEPTFSIKKSDKQKKLAFADPPPQKAPGVNLEARSRVKMKTTGNIAAAGQVVASVDDAASLLAPIRKAAQENAFSVMVGEDGTVIEIHRYGVGSKNAAYIDPVELIGRAGNTPGVSKVYFAHNHPSQSVSPSKQDIFIAERLSSLGAAEGIYVHSLIISGTKFLDITPFSLHAMVPKKIRPTVRKISIPVKERYLVSSNAPVAYLANPDDAAKWAHDNHPDQAGIMLVDNQNNVVGWMNNLGHLAPLKAFSEIIKAMEMTNSNGIIFVSPTKISPETKVFIGRVGAAFSGGDRLLDTIENGKSLSSEMNNFIPSAEPAFAINRMADEKRSLNELKSTFSLRRRDIDRAFARGMMSPEDVAIGNDLDALAVLDRAMALGGGGRPPQHWQNIDAQLDANPYMVKKIRQVEKRAGVKLLDKKGHILKDDIEARTKIDPGTGKFNKVGDIVPAFKGFYRSFAQTYLDSMFRMDNDSRESFRRAVVRSIEEAYKDPSIAVKGELGLTFANMAEKKDYAIGRPLRKADKTMAALNLNTMCPMMTLGLHGCYIDGCYVVGLAKAGQIVNYYSSAMYTAEILQMRDKDISRLNASGGLRVNGMGDTSMDDLGQWADIFRHAEMRGLNLKIITKQDATMEVIEKIRRSGKLGSTLAANTVIQTSMDPYWVEVARVDDVPGSAMRQKGVIDKINSGDLSGAAKLIKDEFHRDAKVINGKVFRKYGYSWEQLRSIGKKYPKLKFLPRVVVATPKEIAEYALRLPEVLQTWMHAKLRPGMWSDIEGAPISSENALNFKYQIAIRKVDGEWRILRQIEKGSLEAGESEPYTAVENYIKANYKPADQEKIFNTLSTQLSKDPSSLCCGISASNDACQTCQSTCAHGSYHTGTDFAKLAQRGANDIGKGIKAIGRTPDILASMRRPQSAVGPIWYSRMEQHIADKMPGRVPASELPALLDSYVKAGKISGEELEWSNIKGWLKDQSGKVSKAQVVDYLAKNGVKVREVMLGEDQGDMIQKVQSAVETLEDRGYRIDFSDDMDGDAYPSEVITPNKYGGKIIDVYDIRYDDTEILPKEDVELITLLGNAPRVNDSSTVYGPVRAPDLNIPGGKNYRELLLTLPSKAKISKTEHPTHPWKVTFSNGEEVSFSNEGAAQGALEMGRSGTGEFRSTHYPEPNILAHVRFDERTNSSGQRVLFIQEVQSDWAQSGRREGFAKKDITKEEAQKMGYSVYSAKSNLGTKAYFINGPDNVRGVPNFGHGTEESAWEVVLRFVKERSSTIPDAPFVKDTGKWAMLAMKSVVRYAAENGFDQVAWTTGKMQAERYQLSTRVDSVMVQKLKDGLYEVRAYQKNELAPVKTFDKLTPGEMAEVVGKGLSEKAIEKLKGVESGYEVFRGLDLDVGGEGMAGFYDKILPAEMNKFFGKEQWGRARVGETTVQAGEVLRNAQVVSPRGTVLWVGDTEKEAAGWLNANKDLPYTKDAKIEIGSKGGVLTHSFDITPEIKFNSMKYGMPLFSMKKTRMSPFYSQMEDVIRERKLSGPSDQILKALSAWVRKGDVKAEEVDWSGVREYIQSAPRKKLTTSDILEFLDKNHVRVVEVTKEYGNSTGLGAFDIIDEDGNYSVEWGTSNPISSRILDDRNPATLSDKITLLDDDQLKILEFIQKGWTSVMVNDLPEGYRVESSGTGEDQIFWVVDKNGYQVTSNSYNRESSINEAINDYNARQFSALVGQPIGEDDEGGAPPSLASFLRDLDTYTTVLPKGTFEVRPRISNINDLSAGAGKMGGIVWNLTVFNEGKEELIGTYPTRADAVALVEDDLDRQVNDFLRDSGRPRHATYTQGGGGDALENDSYRELLLLIPRTATRGWRMEVSREETDAAGHTMYNVFSPSGKVVFVGDEANAKAYLENSPSEVGDDLMGKFKSGHWEEENVVVHIRMTDRRDTDGGVKLFIEEIQSDWHQQGRKSQYEGDRPAGPDQMWWDMDLSKIESAGAAGPSVPDAPFKTSWPLLAIKRMVMWAAENGYQSISWTTGKQQYDQWGSERIDWERIDTAGRPTRVDVKDAIDGLRSRTQEVAFRWKDAPKKWIEEYPTLYVNQQKSVDGYYYQQLHGIYQLSQGHAARDMVDAGLGDFVFAHINESGLPEARRGWKIDAVEQYQGDVFANLQERLRQEALSENIFIDESSGDDGWKELSELVEKIMSRERHRYNREKWEKHIGRLTNKIWDAMHSGASETGRILPRYAGMIGFYDERLVADVNDFFGRKQWGGARVTTDTLYLGLELKEINADESDYQVVHTLKLTPEMKMKALEKGMPLFSLRRIQPPGKSYLEAVNSVLGAPTVTTDEDTAADPFGGLDPEVRKSLGDSKGIVPASFRQRLKQGAKDAWYSVTRHRPYLDPAEDGQITDILRVHQDTGENAVRRAMQILEKILAGLKPKQYQVFSMSLIMDDMIKDRESGLLDDPEHLPFGFTEAKARAYRDYLAGLAAADPAIAAALKRRQIFQEKLRKALVDADLLHQDVLSDPRYFHHQVLQYRAYKEDQENYQGVGVKSQDVRMQRKGWQKGRIGSVAEYNTDYSESEFEVISQGLAQLETMHTMNQIKDRADITPRLNEDAKLANYVAIVGGQDNYDRLIVLRGDKAEIQEHKPLDSGDKALLKKINEEIWALDPTMPFRSKIAQGYARLAKALGIEVDEGIEEGDLGMKAIAAFADSKNEDESIPARMILKAIADRRKFVKETLGKNFKTAKSLMPAEYTTWMPSKSQSWYKAFTITDRLVAAINEGEATLGQENADKIKAVLVKAKNPEWIIPVGLAKTLDGYDQKYEDHWMSKRSRELMSGWKSWTLMSPPRVLKYNLNNMSGDLDIVLAYRPKIFYKYFWKAFADLAKEGDIFLQKNKDMADALRGEIELAYSLGVLGSGWSVQEVSDVAGQLAMKQRLDAITGNDPSLIERYWENTKKYTQFRENLLRLAAFRYFRDQLAAGKQVYGASDRAEIDGIEDNDRKAAKLARELLGDYGNITHAGLWMRAHTMPFYSWMEVNAPRYVRLLRNLPHEEGSGALGAARVVTAGAAKVAVSAAAKSIPLLMKMAGFWVLASLWNRWRFPEEEAELGEQQRAQMHLILGRRDDGSIITLRTQGAFSDALSWFGMETAVADITKMIDGKKSISDQARDMLLATPKKLIGAVRPDVKGFAELLSGKSFYPDPFNPREIRDRVEYIARTFSLGGLYNWAMGRPKRGDSIYKQMYNDLLGLLTYSSDPGEMAYYDVTRIVSDYKKEAGPDPKDKSDAMYYYKQALKFGDLKAATKYLQRYRDLGGTEKSEIGSIKRAHPLGQLSKKDQAAFRGTLSEDELYRLQLAEEWYNRTYRGETREAAKAMAGQEPPEEESPGMTLREGIKLLK